jgi:valyl-tRNA synthetase
VRLELRSGDAATRSLLERESRSIEVLVGTDGAPVIAEPGGTRAPGTVMDVAGDVEVLVLLRGLVDPKKETERVERSLRHVEKDISVMKKRLGSESFVTNAPPDVVGAARDQLAKLERTRERLLEAARLVDEL